MGDQANKKQHFSLALSAADDRQWVTFVRAHRNIVRLTVSSICPLLCSLDAEFSSGSLRTPTSFFHLVSHLKHVDVRCQCCCEIEHAILSVIDVNAKTVTDIARSTRALPRILATPSRYGGSARSSGRCYRGRTTCCCSVKGRFRSESNSAQYRRR